MGGSRAMRCSKAVSVDDMLGHGAWGELTARLFLGPRSYLTVLCVRVCRKVLVGGVVGESESGWVVSGWGISIVRSARRVPAFLLL